MHRRTFCENVDSAKRKVTKQVSDGAIAPPLSDVHLQTQASRGTQV